jgi:ABC-2 type transport system permease protein
MRHKPRAKYLAIALAEIQHSLAYRGGALIDLLTSFVSIAAVYYLWRAVFAAQPQIAGLSWPGMQTYLLIANAIYALLGSTTLRSMMTAVRTGAITSDLLRPQSYLAAQLAQAVGRAATRGAVACLATALVGFVVLHIALPPTLTSASLFVISVGLSFLISFLLNFLIALACFWTKDVEGLLWAHAIVSYIFSGGMIPLALFPRWLAIAALALPFQSIVHTPMQIYLGAETSLWNLLALQACWAIALLLLVRWLWRRGLRVLDIQGG